MSSLNARLLLACIVLSVAWCQLIIPPRPLGYVFDSGSNDAPIHLDVHMGPLCWDCKTAFPILKAVAKHYGADTLKLTFHMFPLPFHHQAYLTATAAETVRKLASVAKAYEWFDKIYNDKLEYLSNDATSNMTTNEVIRLLAKYSSEMDINETEFLAAMKTWDMRKKTRTAWKYSCSKTVSSTPTFFLNDVPLDASSTWTLDDWKEVIDRLLISEGRVVEKDCRKGTKVCNYLPGKAECCAKGEGCIPNVGCRCYGSGCLQGSNVKRCPFGTKRCEYFPGRGECCKKGETCISNVGCRWYHGRI